MLLLMTVSLICATFVGILHAGQLHAGQSNLAVTASPTVVASDAPVRVVLPFIPNSTPSQR